MVQILANIQDLDGITSSNPVGGSLEIALHTYRVNTDDIITTKPFTLPLVDGFVEWDQEPTAPGSAVRIRPRGLRGLPQWYVSIPNQASVTLAELVSNHQVDPVTLQPTATPSPAWAVQLTELQDVVEDLEFTAAGDLGREHVQTVPSASWVIPVPDGVTRRPNVTVYSTAGEQIEADVVSTLTTVTITFPIPYAGSAVLN